MSEKEFSQGNNNYNEFHNNSRRFLEELMLSDNIFDQLFDEDDEDDEFKPDNLENEEDDEESNGSASSIKDEDNLGISLRTRKRHNLSEEGNFQLDDDVFDWELSTFQDVDLDNVPNQIEVGEMTYLYPMPNQIVEIDSGRLKNIKEQLSRHFQLLVQIFLLSKMSDNMFSVTLGTWQLLVYLLSKYSNKNSLYYIQGIENIERLQPLIHQRDKIDENTFRNYLSLFSNNFYEDLLPWNTNKRRK